jgi:hypothetical protein
VHVLGGVRERRRCLAADDRWGLVDELVVLEGLDHEECEVDAARDVALEDRVADVPAPDGEALALALLEVAAAYDRPACFACEDPSARFDLVIDVAEASETADRVVRTGETVDILLDITNPGLWMAHCHIAEHHESGMMFSFRVDPEPT